MNKYEIEILRSLRNLSSSFWDGLFQVITFMGEQYCLILIIAFFIFVIDKEKGQRIAYSVFISLCLNGMVKCLVERIRPFKIDPSLDSLRKETATSFSFPSGHTQNAAVAYLGSALVIKKRWAYISAIILIVLIGFSRLLLGVHYPTDVVVGMILGISCAIFGSYIHQKVEGNINKKMKFYLITLLIFVPLLIILPFIKNFASLNYSSDGIEASVSDYRDLYLSFSMFAGYILAVFLEHKYVDFDCRNSLKIRLVRFLIGIIIFLGFYFGLKVLFTTICKTFEMEESFLMFIFDMLRYFLVPLIGLGIYPIVFRNNLFKKN